MSTDMTDKRFPPDFVWGTATSSYQIEGAVREGGRGPSIWDTFAATPGKIVDGSNGDVACDHFHRFPQDIELMKQLGVQAYRLSLSWPRIFPTGLEAKPLEAGLDFYERLIDELLAGGIDPWITLYHWELPQGLEDLGGWPDRRMVDPFVRYAEAVARRLGDRVGHWITHNEPWCTSHLGYCAGRHAPGRTDGAESLAAAHHVLLSHGRAVPMLREVLPDTARIGIAVNMCPAYPASPSQADAAEARRFDGFFNRWYVEPLLGRGYPGDLINDYVKQGHLDHHLPGWLIQGDLQAIAAPIDFLGANYYSRGILRSETVPEADNAPRTIPAPPPEACTDLGWEVYPEGLYDLLHRMQDDWKLPIVITENGAAYRTPPGDDGQVHDEARVHYLREHLRACKRAIDDGVDVRGYFAWSLLDNFEWQDGFTQRFGLVWVDFETQERIPKDSFKWFAKAARAHAVPEDL